MSDVQSAVAVILVIWLITMLLLLVVLARLGRANRRFDELSERHAWEFEHGVIRDQLRSDAEQYLPTFDDHVEDALSLTDADGDPFA